MITTAIITGFITLITAIFLQFLPKVDALPGEMSTAIAGAFALIEPFTDIIPVASLLAVLGLVLAFEAGMLTLKLVVFFWNRVRG